MIEVGKRIEEEQKAQTGKLNLSGLALTEIPKEITEMIWLKELDLSHNPLKKIVGLDKLNSLTILKLIFNQLTNIDGLKQLTQLKELYLSHNQLTKIEGLEKLKQLKILDLSKNQITEIEGIDKLTSLETLELRSNKITKIEGLKQLKVLINLNLSDNQLTKIEGLKQLTRLHSLGLSSNCLKRIEGLEQLISLNTLFISSNQLTKIEGLENLLQLKILNLAGNNLRKIEGLEQLALLEGLSLEINQLTKIEGLDQLINLQWLNLAYNQLTKIQGFEQSRTLKTLNLSENQLIKLEGLGMLVELNTLFVYSNQLTKIENLDQLTILKNLNLSDNKLTKIQGLERLTAMISLDLSINTIRKIEGLNNLKILEILNLSINKLVKIEGLDNLKSINILDLSSNHIKKIEGLETLTQLTELNLSANLLKNIADIKGLKDLMSKPKLRIDKNDVSKDLQLSRDRKDSHLTAVLNLIDRFLDDNKIKITLPLKVLLLGNHSSGKSTLLNYILSGEIKKHDSTHILNIAYLKRDDPTENLPKAVFFDFGGQDYYHGMYKPFLSHDALYLILWKHSTNRNERILSDGNGITCHHFSLSYWVAQKIYLETEIYSDEPEDPKFVIQTHWREEKNETEPSMGLLEDEKIRLSLIPGKEQKFEDDRQLILSKIDALLEDEKYKREEPKWYVAFLNHLISEGKNNDRFRDIEELLLDPPIYDTKLDDKEDSLKAELALLHRRGLVLYYPNIDERKYWPGPASFAKYVHDHILTKDDYLLKNKGVISLDDFKVNETIIRVLIEQNIIFQDDYNKKIIVPGFLSLTSDDDVKEKYETDTKDVNRTLFYLQFIQYLPFGYINQLISSIGQQGKHLNYWRDEVYFLFEKIEFRINFDYEHLKISVFANQNPNKEIITYLFYTLLGEYWGLEMPIFSLFKEIINPKNLSEERTLDQRQYNSVENYSFLITRTECRPKDLYISLDNIEYVEYQSIWTCQTEEIPCFPLLDNKIDLNDRSSTCKIAPFKDLIKNRYMVEERIKLNLDNPNISSNSQEPVSVFIVYSWDNEDHKTKVLSFCNYLRQKGYNAVMDVLKSQEQSSTDFTKMMHQAMTDYKKVVIILSEGYKEKANDFKSGVGEEYQLIIKDLKIHPNKYILYTFDKVSINIAPLALQQREMISYFEDQDFQKLYSKLDDTPTISFSPIGDSKPKTIPKDIPDFLSLMGE